MNCAKAEGAAVSRLGVGVWHRASNGGGYRQPDRPPNEERAGTHEVGRGAAPTHLGAGVTASVAVKAGLGHGREHGDGQANAGQPVSRRQPGDLTSQRARRGDENNRQILRCALLTWRP